MGAESGGRPRLQVDRNQARLHCGRGMNGRTGPQGSRTSGGSRAESVVHEGIIRQAEPSPAGLPTPTHSLAIVPAPKGIPTGAGKIRPPHRAAPGSVDKAPVVIHVVDTVSVGRVSKRGRVGIALVILHRFVIPRIQRLLGHTLGDRRLALPSEIERSGLILAHRRASGWILDGNF